MELTAGVAKVLFRLGLCRRLFWDGFISPIFNAPAFFGFIAQAIGLFLLYGLFGSKKLTEISTSAVVAGGAFAAAMTCWAIIQVIATPLRLLNVEGLLGAWTGTRFLYNDKKRVFVKEWSPVNNGNLEFFQVPDIPPDALVSYTIEIDGPADRLNCIVLGAYYFRPVASMLTSANFALHGRVRLRKDRTLLLHCLSMPDTVPAIVRVYVLGWEVDRSVLLDYTDLRSDTRIVLGPPA